MKIEIDQYTFHLTVDDYTAAKAGSYSYNAPSDIDYYGYDAEVEWTCDSVEEYFEDDTFNILEDSEMKRIVELYSELLEDKILDKMLDEIEMMKEDSYED